MCLTCRCKSLLAMKNLLPLAFSITFIIQGYSQSYLIDQLFVVKRTSLNTFRVYDGFEYDNDFYLYDYCNVEYDGVPSNINFNDYYSFFISSNNGGLFGFGSGDILDCHFYYIEDETTNIITSDYSLFVYRRGDTLVSIDGSNTTTITPSLHSQIIDFIPYYYLSYDSTTKTQYVTYYNSSTKENRDIISFNSEDAYSQLLRADDYGSILFALSPSDKKNSKLLTINFSPLSYTIDTLGINTQEIFNYYDEIFLTYENQFHVFDTYSNKLSSHVFEDIDSIAYVNYLLTSDGHYPNIPSYSYYKGDSLFLAISSQYTYGEQYVSLGHKDSTMAIFNYEIITGIKNKTEVTPSIYPNPVLDILRVDINGEILSAEIINSTGQIVSNNPIINSSLDVSNLDKGLYFLQTKTASEIKSYKFYKE